MKTNNQTIKQFKNEMNETKIQNNHNQTKNKMKNEKMETLNKTYFKNDKTKDWRNDKI